MGFKKTGMLAATLFMLAVCVGFRPFPEVKGWRIDSSSTAARKVFITFISTGRTMTNDLPSTDALASSGSTLTDTQLFNSVMTDYNSIQASYLTLVTDSDPDYAANNANRRIKIENGAAAGVSSGEAKFTLSGAHISDCTITLTSKAYDSAKTYVALLTHELGHCLGLDHSQATVWSVMSYFYNEEVYRLAIDDKMGIVHLYPEDPSYADEKPTIGMSCARQN